MNKLAKTLIISTMAIATIAVSKQRYLSFAPLEGYAIGDAEVINITIRGQVAKEMFERLVPSVAHDKTDTVCAQGETKVNKFVICDVDKDKNYECKFAVPLNDKADFAYFDDPNSPYECHADPDLKKVEGARREAKKNNYWRFE